MGNNRVPGAVEMPRTTRQRLTTLLKTREKTHKRVTMPSRRRLIQPRLASPRNVNIVPESLSTSRRGSGRWRSSSGSGLSILQSEGSADNENYGSKIGHRQRAVLAAVDERGVLCRPAIWWIHHTESHPKRKWSEYLRQDRWRREDEQDGENKSGNHGRWAEFSVCLTWVLRLEFEGGLLRKAG